jgi:hypothetical protein
MDDVWMIWNSSHKFLLLVQAVRHREVRYRAVQTMHPPRAERPDPG